MKWSREIPSNPGYYWYTPISFYKPIIIELLPATRKHKYNLPNGMIGRSGGIYFRATGWYSDKIKEPE